MAVTYQADDRRSVASTSRASLRARESNRYKRDLRAFGLRVRNLRQSRKLTIEQAAELMDFDPTHLTKIEAGAINVTFATLVRIAVGFDTEIAALF